MTDRCSPRLRIAVVGGGVAGITAAHVLQKAHEVTIFESAARVGGHANAVAVDDGAGGFIDVDTAFLIYNRSHYPSFVAFLRELGVEGRTRSAEMSASFSNHDRDVHYALGRGAAGLLVQPRNIARPRFYRLFAELFLFRRRASADLVSGRIGEAITLRDYLRPYSVLFVESFVVPLASAIWSLPDALVLDYPARAILAFFRNHRLLEGSSGDAWRTFEGSSRVYLQAFLDRFTGTVRTGCSVRAVVRRENGIDLVIDGEATARRFDRVVLATHADISLRILDDPSSAEREALGAWRYHPNTVLLHTDASVLGVDRRAWASWNIRTKNRTQLVTYYLNRVQSIRSQRDLFLTLGEEGIDPARVLERFVYRHPIFDRTSVGTQARLPELNGVRDTYFCGSYAGHGFHEDAVVAGLRVGACFGLGLGLPRGHRGCSPSSGQFDWTATAYAGG